MTPVVKKRLEEESWLIFTDNEITKKALFQYISQKGGGVPIKTEIFYNGREKPVYIVDFETALFLADNRNSAHYSFTAYHRRSDNVPWKMWKEGKKEPGKVLSSVFHRRHYDDLTNKQKEEMREKEASEGPRRRSALMMK